MSPLGEEEMTARNRGCYRNRIVAHVECDGNRKPKTVLVRLPHPEGRKAKKVEGGVYDTEHETVRITPFKGKAALAVHF